MRGKENNEEEQKRSEVMGRRKGDRIVIIERRRMEWREIEGMRREEDILNINEME